MSPEQHQEQEKTNTDLRRMSQKSNTSTSNSMTAGRSSMLSTSSTAGGAAVSLGTKPTLIQVKPMKFLIMDAPRQANLHVYMKEMRKHHVVHVVRVCEPTYTAGELENAGISLHELGYQDGTSPAVELIDKWLQLVDTTFYQNSANNSASATDGAAAAATQQQCIAVHCVAGLGRAPVMVAIALIEFANMDPVEAVSFIRQRRRGAINEKQLLYLEGYKKRYRRSGGAGGDGACCVIL